MEKTDTRRPMPPFTKVYQKGWRRIRGLIASYPTAAGVWAFLADNCGYDNAIVVDMRTIMDELRLSKPTVIRCIRYLREQGALEVGKIGGTNVYFLNNDEVWKTYEEHKHYAAVTARALLSHRENPGLKKRLTHMIGAMPGSGEEDGA